MPHSFFILSRLFVRVDNVLFRIYDVRIYHEFGSGEVVREVFGMEAEYEEVKRVRRIMLGIPLKLTRSTYIRDWRSNRIFHH